MAKTIQSAPLMTEATISDFRVIMSVGTCTPSARRARVSETTPRIRGTKTAATTAAKATDNHDSGIPAASRALRKTKFKNMSHSSPQTTSRRRLGGIPSSESDGHDCHAYFFPSSPLPDVTATGYDRNDANEDSKMLCEADVPGKGIPFRHGLPEPGR
ncbi:hypothetical protein [Arthrobacter sp. MW3 TE3886]|uniref:hypothetical protein n=1 Tax=Arthrobacter sp. MW3 TE3886 TaxID=3156254 RepID=UPI0035150AC2